MKVSSFTLALGVTVSSLSQLLAVMEILITSLGGISTMIIFEGLNPLLLTQKVSYPLHYRYF